jgi:hypothetical protein
MPETKALKTWTSRAALLVLAAVVFLTQLQFGGAPAGPELDPSWSAVLAWAFARGMQFGSDIAFTYGPLGLLHAQTSYVPEAYSAFLIGQFATAGAWAYVIVRIAALLRFPRCLLLIATLVLTAPSMTSDSVWFCYVTLSALIVSNRLHEDPRGWLRYFEIVILAAGVGVLTLAKFTLVPLALVWIVVIAAAAIRSKQVGTALSATLGAIGGLIGGAIVGDQQSGSLIDYVRVGTEVATGYANAMALAPSVAVDAIGFALMCGTGTACCLLIAKHRSSAATPAVFFLVGCVVFVAWRAGFTRADDHVLVFFTTLAVIAASVQSDSALAETRAGRAFATMVMAAAIVCTWASSRNPMAPMSLPKLASLWHIDEKRRERESWRAALASRHEMPRLRELLGSGRVDMFQYEQGLLLLNELNYAPRPVFQGYSAYTHKLLRVNYDYFAGANAPQWVALRLQAIDHRYPWSEDALALIAVLQRYRVRAYESDYIILELDARSSAKLPTFPSARPAKLGDWIEVPDNGAAIAVRMQRTRSFIEQAYGFVFRGIAFNMSAETADGVVHVFRVVPAAAAEGFVLVPFAADTGALFDLVAGKRMSSVRRIRFDAAQPSLAWMPTKRIAVAFATMELPILRGRDRAALPELRLPGVEAEIEHRAGMVEPMIIDGQEALFMHSPAAITMKPPPAWSRLHGVFGVRSEALDDADCGTADGVTLRVLSRMDETEVVLLERTIDPFRNSADRGPQSFEARPSAVSNGESLSISIAEGPAGNPACDWGYVREVRFESDQ